MNLRGLNHSLKSLCICCFTASGSKNVSVMNCPHSESALALFILMLFRVLSKMLFNI